MVVAHSPKVSGPQVLFYGHYDVQPADPIALWDSEPFEPVLRPQPDGETHIVGRGASDDKGALMTFVEACRAYVEIRGALPLNVKFLFEGEEESGSRSLAPFLEATADELRADTVLVCDTDMWDRETPAVTTMLRGLVGQEITITCADRDLHSGMFGNAARNAAQVLGDVISSLRTSDGGVAIAGFYDGVSDLDPAIAALWDRLPFDQEKFLSDIGLTIPAGEAGLCWNRSGRGRAVKSMACGQAIPNPASRRSFQPLPAQKYPSGWWPGRTRNKSVRPFRTTSAP